MYRNPNHPKTIVSVALVSVIALMLCISLGAKPNSSRNTSFEYKVISQRVLIMEMLNQGQQKYPEAHAEAVETTLNKLARAGWELQDTTESFFILKRQLP